MSVATRLAILTAALGIGLFLFWPDRASEVEALLAPPAASPTEGAARAPAGGPAPPSSSRVEGAPQTPDAELPVPVVVPGATGALDLDAEREAEVAPGAIEGLVLRGTVPLDGGHVDFQAGYHERLPSDRSERLARVAEGTLTRVAIGRDGRFSLTGLAAGWYTVGVDTTETQNLPRGAFAGPGLQFDVEVFTDRAGQPLVIVLGAASIVGHVYDDEGRPVVGAVVGLNRVGSYLQRLGTSFAETDATGRYGFHDLLPEVYRVSLVSLPGEGATEYASQLLERLGLDETRVFDLGASHRAVVWRGRVLHPDGSPVERSGTIGRDSRDVERYEEVSVSSLGSFELRLRPGQYELRVRVTTSDSGHRTDYLSLGDVDVPEADFERDLTLPGTSVRGRLTAVELERLPTSLTLSVYPDGEQRPVQSASVGRDGTFMLCALAPGGYRVDLWPGLAAAPGTGLLVHEGDSVLTLDVPVAPR